MPFTMSHDRFSNTMFILLVFTRGVTLKTHQWVRSTWFVWMHRIVFVFLTEVLPGLICFSVKSLEVLCKTIAGVVGEVLSVDQDKADCLEGFFFSLTLWPLPHLMSCSFFQTIQWLNIFFCFTPCKILWKCKSLIGWDACWPTIALVVWCIIYHLFFPLSFEWIVLFPHSLFSYWTA